MDDFYYTLGKWTFIGGGAAIFCYLMVKGEAHLKFRKTMKGIEKLEHQFKNKDPNLTEFDLTLISSLYRKFLEYKKWDHYLTVGYQRRLDEYQDWLCERDNTKKERISLDGYQR